MGKLSNETISLIKNYVLPRLKITRITANDIEDVMDVLLSKITDLVMDIEEDGHTTEENYSLLKEFDAAFDDINETEEIDLDDLNERLKQ